MEHQTEDDEAREKRGREPMTDTPDNEFEELIRRSREWIERVDRCLRKDDTGRRGRDE
ncbi:MAG TPA: hypothetical protein VFO52_07460 [Longimicrobiales bacterium]|nr:hypothetical protein [Longimicrobiales bacterium]